MENHNDRHRLKICFAASSGGHFEQLMMLMPLIDDYDSFVLTEATQYNVKQEGLRLYFLTQVNRREKLFIFKMLKNLVQSAYVFFKERPDVVVTTGVLAILPMCLLAKAFGKKLIYIESFAKVSSPTKTGRFVYKHHLADRFYVQWKEMLNIYPDAIFLGGIY